MSEDERVEVVARAVNEDEELRRLNVSYEQAQAVIAALPYSEVRAALIRETQRANRAEAELARRTREMGGQGNDPN